MSEADSQLFSKENIGKWFKRDNLIILILTGVLLFIIALPTKGQNAEAESGGGKDSAKNRSDFLENTALSENIALKEGEIISKEDYCSYLEDRLQKTLAKMADAGRVQVMITLQSSEELVVEKDKPVNRTNSNEQDSQGGSRISSQMDSEESTVYRTESGRSEPYVVKTLLPKVEGVVVVAEGAGRGTVDKSITEIVQTLFDVEPHKVKVVKMAKND